ncbi:MAG: hypothetical protein C4336_04470 [Armatimonadota bacterium]
MTATSLSLGVVKAGGSDFGGVARAIRRLGDVEGTPSLWGVERFSVIVVGSVFGLTVSAGFELGTVGLWAIAGSGSFRFVEFWRSHHPSIIRITDIASDQARCTVRFD